MDGKWQYVTCTMKCHMEMKSYHTITGKIIGCLQWHWYLPKTKHIPAVWAPPNNNNKSKKKIWETLDMAGKVDTLNQAAIVNILILIKIIIYCFGFMTVFWFTLIPVIIVSEQSWFMIKKLSYSKFTMNTKQWAKLPISFWTQWSI